MAVLRLVSLALLALPRAAEAAQQRVALKKPNPIRKVVTLLQAMQKKVEEEGEREKELYENFECYCKTNTKNLGDSIAAAGTKGPELEAAIKGGEEQKTQLQADLVQAKKDREEAKQTVGEATSIREKEAAAFAATKKDAEANIAAMGKALEALRRGSAGGFLQTSAAQTLREMLNGRQSMLDDDRDALASFLSTGSEDADGDRNSGEIIGILSELRDQMTADLKKASEAEAEAVQSHRDLVKAKEGEIEALTQGIEAKTERLGELGVTIVNLQGDLRALQDASVKNTDFLAALTKSCSGKKAEYEEREKSRGEELLALADTIKMLNDDDAQDLFKKTLPSAGMFMQLQVTSKQVRARALEVLGAGRKGQPRVLLDLVSLALHSKKVSFEKVVQMVDAMVDQLKKEQVDDDDKKEYCSKQLEMSEAKKQALDRSIADTETALAASLERIGTLKEEIAKLDTGIKALDKSVAEATEQRKEENQEFTELIASNNAAKQLITMAKNRLNQFYNPTLAPSAAAFVQVSAHSHHRHRQLPPAPETAGGKYQKSEESSGVLAMLDLLVKDLDKEITEAEAEEKNAQSDYETLMKDSTQKRVADSKALAEKTATVTDLEASVESLKGQKASSVKELQATAQYIAQLHTECDWLKANFEVRKEARLGEIDSLKKSKAVLSGADYSLLQTRAHRTLLRRAN